MRPTVSHLAALAASMVLAFSLATTPPAFAHDGVHVIDPYARTSGGQGASGAIFFVVDNHQIEDDRLISVASDVAARVEIHTHFEDVNGVMQMRHLVEGLPIPANDETVLGRAGNHVMLLGLTRALKDGDVISLTLTFERSGEAVIDVPVDNARKPEGQGSHDAHDAEAGHSLHETGHGTGHAKGKGDAASDTTGMADAEAIRAVLVAESDTPENPLSVEPVVMDGDHALASWSQGDEGGRALLAKRGGAWVLVLFAGADLRLPSFLKTHGVSGAASLSARFNAAEDGLGADRVALHSSFEGVAMNEGASH